MKSNPPKKGSLKRTVPQVSAARSPFLRTRLNLVFVASLGIWLPSMEGATLVDLDATDLPEGPLPTWSNAGSLGDFTSAGTVVPEVTTALGVKGVSFIGGTSGSEGTHYIGPEAPFEVTAFNPRTIEAWIFNPSPQGEETVVGWGRRGGPEGSNLSFNHGTNGAFGAVGQWGAPDLGWDGNIAFGRWTYIAYTYDGFVASVFRDGELANSDEVDLDTWAWDDTPEANPLPFRVARQNNGDGTPSGVGVGEITIAKIRIHDEALSADDLKTNFEQDRAAFALGDADGDGLLDWFEDAHDFLDPNDPSDADEDFDQDGLSNLEEFESDTDPTNPDSDGDGLTDGEEAEHGTNPLNPDSDGDLLRDGREIELETDPLNPDTDDDGFTDFEEVFQGSDPKDAASIPEPDTDGDGLRDSQESELGTEIFNPDSDGDGFPDGQEVFHGSDPRSAASTPQFSPENPMIHLEAADLSEGPLELWPNQGAMDGFFQASPQIPPVETVEGIRAVSFDGTSHFYTGPNTPVFFTGGSSRTVEAWVFNPSIANEETIFAWGRRGGGEGTNTSFNHGSNGAFGAVGHWGAPDIGWDGNIVAGEWTHVVYTWNADDLMTTVYQDGEIANTEELANPLDTWRESNTTPPKPLPFRVASQNEANGNPTGGLRGSMSIARIRVFDFPLSAQQVADLFAEGLSPADGPGDAPLIQNVSIDRESGTISFSWEVAPGASYAVEVSEDLSVWSVLNSGLTSGIFNDTPAPSVRTRYYRLKVE